MNGKVGDHPVSDICDYGRTVFSPEIDELVREIHQYLGRERMWELLDWFEPPPLPMLEADLRRRLSALRADAEARGWEPK